MMATSSVHSTIETAAPTLRQLREIDPNAAGQTSVTVVRRDGSEVGRYLLDGEERYVAGSVLDRHGSRHPAIDLAGFGALLVWVEATR